MKKLLFLMSFGICFFHSKGQWTTSGNIYNTNVGAVSIVRNTGFTNPQLFVINPKGAGTITFGEPNTGAGGYTSLSFGLSAGSGGYTYLQAVKSAGTSYGVISLNPSGGNVGIGTADPGSFKLAVEGKIGAREVKVTNTSPWPDYVFKNDYQLRDLSSLENFIKDNHHLPGIASAEEIRNNQGVDLGEMSVKILEKVEELTLYIIKLDKNNARLQKENAELKAMIEKVRLNK